ncbi:CHAT domain-containing protein [Spongiimicrobium salis]|uniref:CHAT domain-containing protein n=1 Tax=Spongiimicrobium salis TaxID=1667022 RepID=UPI00374CB33C
MRYLIVLILCSISINGIAQEKEYQAAIAALTEKAYQHLYTQKDSAYYYFEEIIALSTEEKDWKNAIESLIGISRVAGYAYDLEKLGHTLNTLDSLCLSQEGYLETLPEKELYSNSILNDQGVYYFNLDDFKASRAAFSKILSATEHITDSLYYKEQVDLRSVAFSFMAKMYNNEGKYDQAKLFYLKSIRFIEDKKPDDLSNLATNYGLLAEVYRNEGDYRKSNGFFIKSLDEKRGGQRGTNFVVSALKYIVQNHLDLEQQDSAQHYLTSLTKKLPLKHPFRYQFYRLKADLARAQGNYSQTIANLEQSLRLIQEKWKTKKHEEVAFIYHEIGLSHFIFGHPREALKYYDLGLQQLVKGKDLLLNSNGPIALKLFKNKAQALMQLQSRDAYIDVLSAVDQGITILDRIRPTFRSKNDKLFLIDDAFPLFELGLEAAHQLYRETGNHTYLDKVMRYMEKSKAILLLESVLGTRATEFAQIPQAILEQERQLKSKIAHVEKRLGKSKSKTALLEDELFQLKNEYNALSHNLEEQYPTYFNLKYNTETRSADEVQQHLTPEKTVISYFYGKDHIYGMALSKKGKDLIKIPLDTVLKSLLQSVRLDLGNPQSNAAQLAKNTYQVYQQILAPLLESHPTTQILVLTDGFLNYIPFEALNTNAEGTTYLLESSRISYAQSATLLHQLSTERIKNNSILGFAPSFPESAFPISATPSSLLPLPHNTLEVEQVLEQFSGKSFLDSEASLTNFHKSLSEHSILHLATHAILDDTSPEYSYLAFSSASDTTEVLYLQDLYQLELKANLVTLSACSSGIGTLKRGEGFISLAQGFFYSGAQSIASTLWNINDASSARLMSSFYGNLAQSDAKDLALQKAKLSFLQENRENGLSHPYYWSSFILSGNTAPLISSSPNWWYPVGGIILIGILFFWLRRKP